MVQSIQKAKEQQEHLFNELASLIEALASPVRLKIIHFLSQAPHSVDQLSSKLGQSIANTSMHLKKMQRENLLKVESLGQKRIYSLAQQEMLLFWEQIQSFALAQNQNNKIPNEEIYQEKIEWEYTIEETIKLIKARKITLIDVRPHDEVITVNQVYKKYVTHLPFEDLIKNIKVLPTSRPLLIICRGRFCVMSGESTYLLRKKGYDAYKSDFSWYQISSRLNELN